MGTKRPFDEELQEFIKHPKHFDYGNKQAVFSENRLPLEASQNVGSQGEGGAKFFHVGEGLESENVITGPETVDKEFGTNVPLPLVTGIGIREEDAGYGPVFCSNLFPEFFECNLPRRQLVHFDDTYTSLLSSSPRKEVPVGPDHQADVPEFDSEVVKNCLVNYSNIFENGGGESLVGASVIPMSNTDSTLEGEDADVQIDCKCLDGGSVRCVQQHVKEARLKLRESLGHEKFVNLGLSDMGEEVASRWTEADEHLFHEVVYSNPVSLDKRFWEQLAIAFPSRTKKELVSYYFNVFMLRRRAVQNRSKVLEIDSDDDEWRGSNRGPLGVGVEDEDFIVDGSFIVHGNHDSSSEDGDVDGNSDDDGGDGDIVIGIKEDSCTSLEDLHSLPNSCKQVNEMAPMNMNEKVTSENEQEKPLNVNKEEASNGGLRLEYSLQTCDSKVWDPPFSSMCPTKGVDLLPTCSMIEEIFGSSKNGNSTFQ